MCAHIIGISGSPRPDGTTERVMRSVLEATDLPYELIRLWELDVQPCKGCLGCVTTNTCRGIDDDWPALAARIVRADALVLGGWAPFNMLDARSKAVMERAFSLRHSILLNAGMPGVAVVTGTVDPRPVAAGVLAYFETEGIEALGAVTPAGIDPCWSCGLGDRCTQGAPVPLVRGEYELFRYPHADRLPAPESFRISLDLIPPPAEEQPDVLAEAARLGRLIRARLFERDARRTADLEDMLPDAPNDPSLMPPLQLLELLIGRAVDGGALYGDLRDRTLQECSVAREAVRHDEPVSAIRSLLTIGRGLLMESGVAIDEREAGIIVAEARRAIAGLYG